MTHEKLAKEHCDWLPEAFEAFWEAYPKKTDKALAMEAWDRLRPSEREIPRMMRSLSMYVCFNEFGEECGKIVGCRCGQPDYTGGHKGMGCWDPCLYARKHGFELVTADVYLLDRPWVYRRPARPRKALASEHEGGLRDAETSEHVPA